MSRSAAIFPLIAYLLVVSVLAALFTEFALRMNDALVAATASTAPGSASPERLQALVSPATIRLVASAALLVAVVAPAALWCRYSGHALGAVLRMESASTWGRPAALLLVGMAVSMARAPFSPFLGTTRPTAVELSLVVLTALLSVLSEEMVFRGVVQSVLRPFGVRAACVVSSLLFAAQHLLAEPFGAYRLILLFCLGLVLAGSLESTGSLWYPVAVHAAWNLGAEGLAMLRGRGVDAVAAFYASPGFVAAEAAALVVLWLVVLRLTEVREASWRPTRPGEPD